MKLSCYNKSLLLIILLSSQLFGAIQDKSAMLYYGKNISYPMVGIHDYIIVQPSHINTHTHGFKTYKNRMYAYVSIGEIDRNIKEYKSIKKSWIATQNRAWSSDVLDITNLEYQEFLFTKMIEKQIKRGFKNFFFDTLDSYQLYSKTKKQRAKSKKALIHIINTFHKRYPDSKLIINRGFEIIDEVHNSIEAILFESYYRGIAGDNLNYKKVSDMDREWLDIYLDKIKSYKVDIIAVDYLKLEDIDSSKWLIKKLQSRGMIPFISIKSLDIYGKSSKNAIKREIFTLIDESKYDRVLQAAHTQGALPLEYMGYIQKIHDINKGLPTAQEMSQYAGVIIWLNTQAKDQKALIEWLLMLKKMGLKFAFANSFSLSKNEYLKKLDIKVETHPTSKLNKSTLLFSDKMIGFEINPPLHQADNYYKILKGDALFRLKDSQGNSSTLGAIMPWGGYSLFDSFNTKIAGDNIWSIDPFAFFTKALRLQELIVPDTTTKNGKRLLFTHLDGDGIMNRTEWNSKLFSGDIILNHILKKYQIPHSISIIGAQIDSKGLYPKLSNSLQKIVKDIYSLKNVEAATHTYSHPFYWEKIINDDLDESYRLKVKDYHFSLKREIIDSLENINQNYIPKGRKKAHTIFWTGNTQPSEKVLKYIYENNLLNINGGDTYISNLHPWLSYIAPLGLGRGEFYQIYTGAQNENIYTNGWRENFWGYKKIIQTFKLTNSPRRYKPIDIYYHFYSGSKKASLNALKYAFEWSISQDVFPIFTSQYIPIAMDYYTLSMAKEGDLYLFDGMKNIKTLRIEKKDISIKLASSKNILGYNHFEKHTFIHVGDENRVLLKPSFTNKNRTPYLISSNANVELSQPKKDIYSYNFSSNTPTVLELFIPKRCSFSSSPKTDKKVINSKLKLKFTNTKQVKIDVQCR